MAKICSTCGGTVDDHAVSCPEGNTPAESLAYVNGQPDDTASDADEDDT